MNKETLRSLGEYEQQLLHKYFDGECTWWESFRVQRLLKRDDGQAYLQELRVINEVTCDHYDGSLRRLEAVDLKQAWTEIERRISGEEHASFLSGVVSSRKQEGERPRGTWLPLAYGFGSACALASVSFFLVFGGANPITSSLASNTGSQVVTENGLEGNRLGDNQPVEIQPVGFADHQGSSSLGRSEPYVPPRILGAPGESSVELEWMRSSGRVQLIQDYQRRSTVIWVKRRGLGPQGSTPRLLNERIPTATMVSSK